MAPPKRRLYKRLGCGCLSFLVALTVGLVVLELLLRRNVSHFLGTPAAGHFMYEMDAGRSYTLRPGWTGEQVVEGRATQIHVNSSGMRGPELEAKSADEIRLLVLGDSFIFGYGVADDETVPAQLQRLVGAESGSILTVGNCGVAGYGTRDLADNLQRHLDLQPDLVIACTYLGNDFSDDCREYSAVVEGFLLNGAVARLAHTSARFRLTLRYRSVYLFERILDEYWPGLAFDRSRLQDTAEEVAAIEFFPPQDQRFGGLFFDRRSDDELVRKVTERCRQSYLDVARVARAVPVLHVVIPTWWHLSEERWRSKLTKMRFDPAEYEVGASQRRLLQLAREVGAEMVDLTPQLRDCEQPEALWLPTDRHFSARGCQQVASWLLPHVRRLLGR